MQLCVSIISFRVHYLTDTAYNYHANSHNMSGGGGRQRSGSKAAAKLGIGMKLSKPKSMRTIQVTTAKNAEVKSITPKMKAGNIIYTLRGKLT